MYTISVDSGSSSVSLKNLLKSFLLIIEKYPGFKFRVFVDSENFFLALKLSEGHPRVEVLECKYIASVGLDLSEIYYDVESDKYDYTVTRAVQDCICGASDACLIMGDPLHASIIAGKLERKIGTIKQNSPKGLAVLLPTFQLEKRLLLDVGIAGSTNLFNLALLGETFGKYLFKSPQKISFVNSVLEDNRARKDTKKSVLAYREKFPHSVDRLFIKPNELFKKAPCTVAICNGSHGNLILETISGMLDFIAFINKKEEEKLVFPVLSSMFFGESVDTVSEAFKERGCLGFLLGFRFPIFTLSPFLDQKHIASSIEDILSKTELFTKFLEEFDKLNFEDSE